ncbi:alpha/beta hydrolase [Corynebacterium halotolerans]|uniref:Trehalose corynomycolyl transferase A n=1 Tax=Corynebacterium halotolerans YIM 70093 = DSM 44683 TaxID=1121362 RepID=M1NIY9_9CORY|nr:alpha/beta hydrolase family protein [Corynebacterium halotolerans]AGF71388.1 trehalose corynomycolyl transferase A [Corynebacterium halotolerans YIM 70093 = DSM 44683]
MKPVRSVIPTLAALALTGGILAAPVAGAAELTPTDVNGGVPVSTISQMTAPVTENSPEWRTVAREWVAENPAAREGRIEELNVYSPSMGRDIPVAVIHAADKSTLRPTLYMLNGAGGAEQDNDWITLSPILDLYEDKNVNLVIPMEGAFSYYTDWLETPGTGYLKEPQMWETFLTKELPGPIEEHLGASNERGIAGFSMSATSSLLLAEHNQGFYDTVGSFSGCALTSYPLEYEYLRLTTNRGGGEPEQMWGPQGSPYNVYNDALVNAENLRGTELYISNGSGLAGETDLPGHYTRQGADPLVASVNSAILQIEGGVIEAGTNACTHHLKAKLDSLDIPADYNFRPVGTHSWPYWRADLAQSWETFDRAFTTDE